VRNQISHSYFWHENVCFLQSVTIWW